MTGAPSDHGTLLPGTPSQTPAERSHGENAIKPTPGPWRGDRVHRSEACVHVDTHNRGDEVAVCYSSEVAVCYSSVDGGFETARANARLIAAAPDLLAALDHLVTAVFETEKQWGRAINISVHCSAIAARDVITKAQAQS